MHSHEQYQIFFTSLIIIHLIYVYIDQRFSCDTRYSIEPNQGIINACLDFLDWVLPNFACSSFAVTPVQNSLETRFLVEPKQCRLMLFTMQTKSLFDNLFYILGWISFYEIGSYSPKIPRIEFELPRKLIKKVPNLH